MTDAPSPFRTPPAARDPAIHLSVVVPCFNEKQSLLRTDGRLRAALAAFAGRRCEIVYVNDGSRDGSEALLDQLAGIPGADVETRAIHFSRNFGHSAAVTAGLAFARGAIVAIIDADLQDPPELLAPMCAELEQGYDVVYGQRIARHENAFKRGTAWGFYRLLNALSDTDIPNDTGDFRVMRRPVVQALLSCPERDPFVRGLVAWVGFRQKPFLYERANRELGTTKYPLHKMFRFAFSALLAFSAQPLYLGIYLGLLGILSAAAITGWALWQWGVGHTVPGWTSLLLAYMTGQSVILGVLGVFGVYLARLFREVQGRPRFVVRRISGGDAPAVPDAGSSPPVRQWRSQLDT